MNELLIALSPRCVAAGGRYSEFVPLWFCIAAIAAAIVAEIAAFRPRFGRDSKSGKKPINALKYEC